MGKLWLLAVLCACGPDSRDIHGEAMCNPEPNDAAVPIWSHCELACTGMPTMQPQMMCSATNPADPQTQTCFGTFERDGSRGCCLINGSSPGAWLRFYQCN